VAVQEYGIIDLQYIAAGAAILAGGGGGSYRDAVNVLDELAATGWSGTIPVRDYDGATPCCVPAFIKVGTAPKLRGAPGVAASFAGLLRRIGYAGALPCSG
jgi:hypothetical protein